MIMKKITLTTVGTLLLIYFLGFFFITPLMLSADAFGKSTTQRVYARLYAGPIGQLSAENPIRRCWNAVNVYWCSKDAECTIVE